MRAATWGETAEPHLALRHPNAMELPRVDPVGLTVVPNGFGRSARVHSRAARVLACGIALAFALVATATTVLTLGAYCITSQAGTPSPISSGRVLGSR